MRLVKYSTAYKRLNIKGIKFDYINILINLFMRKGNKLLSVKLIYNFLFKLKLKFKLTPQKILNKIFLKYELVIRLIKKKIAGRIYNLPYFINRIQGRVLLLHWFVESVKQRFENKLSDKLYFEFLDFSTGYGRTIRKIEEYYLLALKNQPFLRFLNQKQYRSFGKFRKFSIFK